MPKVVTTASARALWSDGVPFVDVLPATAFAHEHVLNAINVPLADIAAAPRHCDPAHPVVVYCYDHQ